MSWNYNFTFGLHHMILISWLGLVVGMVLGSNIFPQMGMIEWLRIFIFVGILYGVLFLFAWKNKRRIIRSEKHE